MDRGGRCPRDFNLIFFMEISIPICLYIQELISVECVYLRDLFTKDCDLTLFTTLLPWRDVMGNTCQALFFGLES